MPAVPFRIGIDLGGTKIAGILLGGNGTVAREERIAAPRGVYRETIEAICAMVGRLEAGTAAGAAPSVGIGMPGSVSPATGRVQNANSTWLNGQCFGRDLEAALGRPVRLANDANCFALSEAADGAAAGARTVFGVIIGTGCGGAIVRDGRLVDGPHGIAGEWGHCPLPWPEADEFPGPACWCGRASCLELWVSGSGLARDFQAVTGEPVEGETIVKRAMGGDAAARAALGRHAHRLARGLAMIQNILDPDVIVLGGGLSRLDHLYTDLPRHMQRYILSDAPRPDVRRPKWGDASGVRGAARLWD
jgi:fructokinase